MYIRTIKRKNKDGSVVEYVQLAHNVRHPEKRYPKAEVIYSFGRREELDIDALKRLVNSISRFFEPEDKLKLQVETSTAEPITFIRSQPAGGAFLLRALWDRLQIGECLRKALKKRSFSSPIASALFAMVANRALAPSSKLAIEQWAAEDVFLGTEEDLQVQHC